MHGGPENNVTLYVVIFSANVAVFPILFLLGVGYRYTFYCDKYLKIPSFIEEIKQP